MWVMISYTELDEEWGQVIPATVTDEHGSVINLSLPANIEVAFERVR